MKNFANAVVRFFKDEEGASAIEYALIVGLVSLALATLLGTIDLGPLITRINAALD